MTRIYVLIAVAGLATALIGCEDDGYCYYNCPDESTKICGMEIMGEDDGSECEQLANSQCAKNPGHLEDWDGGVMHQLLVCASGDVCGIPDWCLPE